MGGIMSLYIDRKFLLQISMRLQLFKQKSEYVWNFRCPICGDSHKNRLKARGYVYRRKSDLFFSCHNCGASMSFGNFLKYMNRPMYDEYAMERFTSETSGNTPRPDFTYAQTKPVFDHSLKIDLPTIESLPYEHPAKQELVRRKIPKEWFSYLYYAMDYREFIHELLPEYDYTRLIENDSRIVIPFYDEEKNLLGVQGREMKKTGVKYITIKTDDNAKKVFGLDKIDFSKPIYVVEGIFDSMIVPNSIAILDSSLFKVRTVLGDHDYILVPDRDVRNREVVKSVEKMIDLNYKVCLLPPNFPGKDLNEALINGVSSSEIVYIIDRSTYQGLQAKLEFVSWKKI